MTSPRPKQWRAIFPGICANCGHRFEPDVLITTTPGVGYTHVICPEISAAELADKAALEAGRCPRCLSHHPGDC